MRRSEVSFAIASAVSLVVILGLSLWVANEGVRGGCDEPVPGTPSVAGCAFLSDIGYDLIRIIPAAVVAAVTAAAWRSRRVWPVAVGFVAAFALLAIAMAVSPHDYPWV